MLVNENGLCFFQFQHFANFPGVRHGMFTRIGGYSQGRYEGLNVSAAVGDDPGCVAENRRAIASWAGDADLIFLKQVHGPKVQVVDDPSFKTPHANLIGDAMITRLKGAFLVIQTADCQAVLIVDPIKRVIANIHSGWRGSVHNIIGQTVQRMSDIFSCRPRDLLAGIGPSLGPCCAEFVNYQREIPEKFWQYKDANDHFDFWAISHMQLRKSGLLEGNIKVSDLCTRCRSDLFYSYRRRKTTGRFASVIGLT